ncbi:MAG: hypothetical protein K6C05_07945 [Anaerovibrio sp.]|uniref:hypothetical protein n=1 Tax=Anaerovibrio sp. TaxID=1872532 RepID=UPI0025D35E9B|nr:hypothetical protein [Anaerovibrio sp.]MCR5176771.1 hypothetical protein [Anaerovibrio sp.]
MKGKKGKRNERKGRRINYSRKELAEYLHCSENAVDDRLKRITDYYDKLDETSFKKETDNNRNFFPPEYTPILKILMREHENNPAAKKRARGLVVDDIDKELNGLQDNKYTFLVEAFIISNLTGHVEKKTLSIIADIAKIFDIDSEELRVIAQVAKCKLVNDMDLLHVIPLPTKNRWMNKFWGYIPYEWIVKNRQKVGSVCTKKYKKRANSTEEYNFEALFGDAFDNKTASNAEVIVPCNIVDRIQAGSVVKEGEILLKYIQKTKRQDYLDSYGIGFFSNFTKAIQEITAECSGGDVEEKKVIKAPCDGIVFFIDYRKD